MVREVTDEELKQATAAGQPLTPKRVLSPEEILQQEEAAEQARRFKAPVPAGQFKPIVSLEEALEVEGILGVKPEVTKRIEVGTKTEEPEEVEATTQLEKLRTSDPRLFKVLKEQGIDAFRKARQVKITKAKREVSVQEFVIQQTLKRQERLEKKLKPFKSNGGYNIGEAIKAGIPIATLKAVGFNKKQITEGKEFADYLKSPPEKKFKALKDRGVIPGNAVFQSIDKSGAISYTFPIVRREETVFGKEPKPVKLPVAIWRAITPWDEENKQTFANYVRHQFQFGGGKSQTELKAEFDAFQSGPQWQKILFEPSVVFDKKSGKYLETVIGYGLPIGPAKAQQAAKTGVQVGRTIVRTLNADDIGMSVSQFDRFIRARGSNPRLSPEAFKFAEKLAAEGVKFNPAKKININKYKRLLEESGKLTVQQRKARAAQRAMKGDATQEIINETLKFRRAATTVESRMAIPGALTAATMELLIQQWLNMPQGKVLDSMQSSNAVAATTAYNPAAMSAVLQRIKLKPAEQTQLKTQTKIELKTANLTKTQTDVIEDTLTQTLVSPAVETVTKTETDTVTKTQVEQQFQTDAKPTTTTKTKTVTPKVKDTVTDKTKGRVVTTKTPSLRGKEEKEKRKEISKTPGVIVWRQGQLQGKSRWDVLMPPYTIDDYYILVGKKPAGNIKEVSGPGSARKTAQVINGITIPKQKNIDTPGPFNVELKPAGKRRISLQHFQDEVTKSKEPTAQEIKSAIAWKAGGEIHALFAPYRRGIDERTYPVDKQPEGLKILNKKGSQQSSVRLRGQLKNPIAVDDIIITPSKRGRRATIRPSRDTRGPVKGLTISRKRGRVFHTKMAGGTVTSRKPLKGIRNV